MNLFKERQNVDWHGFLRRAKRITPPLIKFEKGEQIVGGVPHKEFNPIVINTQYESTGPKASPTNTYTTLRGTRY